MLDKKKIWAISLFEFKMDCKAAETNCNIIINNININNNWLWNCKCMYRAVVVQEVWRGNASFEDEEHIGWPLEVSNDQLRGSSELILLQLHEKLLKNSTLTAVQLFRIWSKLEQWKSSISGCLMSRLQILKIVILKSVLLFNAATVNHSSIGFWCATKGILLNNKQRAARSQNQTCAKRSWSLFGGLLPALSTTAFWILVKSLHLRSALSKLIKCTEHCNVWSQHWSAERTQLFSMTTPNHRLYNQCFKSWTHRVTPHLPYSLELLPTGCLFKTLDNLL